MYSDDDLEAAVSAGVLDRRAVSAFREFMAHRQSGQLADEEHFRLITSFNDIFVSIAVLLVLAALTSIGIGQSYTLGGLLCAAASWGLAEFFTRKRRMALPSILLLGGWTGGVFAAGMGILNILTGSIGINMGNNPSGAIILLGAGLAACLAAWVHWRRFYVPATVAAGAGALVAALVGLLMSVSMEIYGYLPMILLLCGLAIFAYAMKWDSSDRNRSTRRSDVAFWLHLLAAGLIVHPVFELLPSGGLSPAQGAALVLGVYAVLALVALIIDRRAVLVSSLAYVLYAVIGAVFSSGLNGMESGISWAAVVLPIGSLLLLFSAFWHSVRRLIVGCLPSVVRDHVPAVN